MKRSEINEAIIAAGNCFRKNGWYLPTDPKWDVTDFGLGSFKASGLVLVNLAEEPEYCEKVMYSVRNQVTPAHMHKKKKEDIICRAGNLMVQVWSDDPAKNPMGCDLKIKINGEFRSMQSGDIINLKPGERVTLETGVWHEFYAGSDECIIGEVSTANDDLNDNFFSNPDIGRFTEITEDEALVVKLVSEREL